MVALPPPGPPDGDPGIAQTGEHRFHAPLARGAEVEREALRAARGGSQRPPGIYPRGAREVFRVTS
ncbi:hypothetical protein GCM10010339_19290 [Streptomyces alanosinicus]|uniref:Uncharacterized protein n=1 Tax=Streptomyces alanosinicus TaxID=68171 RepID=A0A918YFM1_9ACTN|nr:hypothetical protein GCM10010339_19290 [Streptomyces alanosinicus]